MPARISIRFHFARERAVDEREVSGSKDHSHNPPNHSDLQAVVTRFGGVSPSTNTPVFRAGSTIGYTPKTTLVSIPVK